VRKKKSQGADAQVISKYLIADEKERNSEITRKKLDQIVSVIGSCPTRPKAPRHKEKGGRNLLDAAIQRRGE